MSCQREYNPKIDAVLQEPESGVEPNNRSVRRMSHLLPVKEKRNNGMPKCHFYKNGYRRFRIQCLIRGARGNM